MVAMADWLSNHIEMPLATQAQFYAFTFVPNCFKPLYAFRECNRKERFVRRHPVSRGAADHFSCRCAVPAWECYTYCVPCRALVARSGFSPPLLFFYSCAELMLGAYLMEILHHGNTPASTDRRTSRSLSPPPPRRREGASFMYDAGAVNAIWWSSIARRHRCVDRSRVHVPRDSPNSAPRPATVLSLTGLIAASVAVIGLFSRAFSTTLRRSSPQSFSRRTLRIIRSSSRRRHSSSDLARTCL